MTGWQVAAAATGALLLVYLAVFVALVALNRRPKRGLPAHTNWHLAQPSTTSTAGGNQP